MENTPCHFEIPADDVAAAQEFYGGLFGWSFTATPSPEGEYVLISTSQEPGALGGALVKRLSQRQMTIYFTVDSIDAAVEKVESLGGSITTPKTAVPKMGWAVAAQDPQGNTIGLFQVDPEAA